MRVIAGKHKGRRIECPEGKVVRPSTDMLRSAVFNILNFKVDWENSNALDVCCGTGAFGIEALSRGVKFVGFIDSNRESIDYTRKNLSKLGEEGNYELINYPIENLPQAKRSYQIIYVDPPYGAGLVPVALKNLKARGWIAEDAFILAELADRDKFTAPPGFIIKDERRYGNSKLVLLDLEK